MAKNTSVILSREQELEIENLRAAIVRGEESGQSQTFDVGEFVAAKRKTS